MQETVSPPTDSSCIDEFTPRCTDTSPTSSTFSQLGRPTFPPPSSIRSHVRLVQSCVSREAINLAVGKRFQREWKWVFRWNRRDEKFWRISSKATDYKVTKVLLNYVYGKRKKLEEREKECVCDYEFEEHCYGQWPQFDESLGCIVFLSTFSVPLAFLYNIFISLLFSLSVFFHSRVKVIYQDTRF